VLQSLTGSLAGGPVTWNDIDCPDDYLFGRRAVLQLKGTHDSRTHDSGTLTLKVCEARGGRGGAPAAGNFEITNNSGSVRGSVAGTWTWTATDNLNALLAITSGTGTYRSLGGTLSVLAELGEASVGTISVFDEE
jgi:hypothetical protein